MEFKKNSSVVVTIEDMGHDGEGIGKIDGYTLFVKDAVIGDVIEAKVVKAKKNYGYARLERVISASEKRVEPRCEFARKCGGCQIQELDYEEQLAFKERRIENDLRRIGGLEEVPMEPILGMDEPFLYRNKAQFPIGVNRDGKVITGFYAGRTHDIIENRKCLLGVSVNEEVLNRVIGHMETYGVSAYNEKIGKGLVRHVLIRYGFATGEVMVCLVVNGERVPRSEVLVESLREIPGMTSVCLNVNREKGNVILGKEVKVLWGQGYIADKVGGIIYQISPLSFFQVNPVQMEKLYDLVKEFAGLTGEEVVWDLYCGIGTISLYLAPDAKKVYGVEVVPEAIEDARRNGEVNGISNVEFFVGKAEDVLPELREDRGVDVVVVDPPRKGCDEGVLETIVEMGVERVVYVSCDSATLGRDLKYLCEKGYEVKRVRGVDQFCQTVHVETVVSLSLKKGTHRIEVVMEPDGESNYIPAEQQPIRE